MFKEALLHINHKGHRVMKIAVVSFYAVTNIGDKILTDTVCWMLKKNGHQPSIVDIDARYAFKYAGLCGKIERKIVPCFIKRDSEETINNYFKSSFRGKDLILFAGGQIISMAISNCSQNIYRITKIAEQMEIPIAYNAVGLAGSAYDGTKGQYLKYALSSPKVVAITARERIADINQFLISGEASCKATWVSDTAVWCDACYKIKRNEKAQVVGINVISEASLIPYYKESIDPIETYVTIYRIIRSMGYECKFFTNGVPRDMLTVKEILKRLDLRAEDEVLYPLHTMKGKSFVKLLSSMSFIVSSRLHTSICSYSLKIPTVAFSWDDKIQTFYGHIGCPERCLDVTLLQSDPTYLSTLISKAIAEGYDEQLYTANRNSVANSLDSIISKLCLTPR